MKAEKPQPVKFFIGALFSDEDLLSQAQQLCIKRIGDIDFHSESFPFDETTYYDGEMGRPIFRMFFSFQALINPGELANLKIKCNEIEETLSVSGARKVNLDIGYLDFHKMVLASAKYNGQKIYLDHGIYADPTLIFERGKFHPFEHTFPDFKQGSYTPVFEKLRNCYKTQLKS